MTKPGAIHHPSTNPMARLDDIAAMAEGWLNDDTPAPRFDAVDAMRRWLHEIKKHERPDAMDTPYLYPTPNGGVVAEWSWKGWDISVEIDPPCLVFNAHAVDLDALRDDKRDRNAPLRQATLSTPTKGAPQAIINWWNELPSCPKPVAVKKTATTLTPPRP